jgi:hypothetical protein
MNRWIWLASYLLILLVVALSAIACGHVSPALQALDALCKERPNLLLAKEAVENKDLRLAVKLLREYTERYTDDDRAKGVLLLLEDELARLSIP